MTEADSQADSEQGWQQRGIIEAETANPPEEPIDNPHDDPKGAKAAETQAQQRIGPTLARLAEEATELSGTDGKRNLLAADHQAAETMMTRRHQFRITPLTMTSKRGERKSSQTSATCEDRSADGTFFKPRNNSTTSRPFLDQEGLNATTRN